MTSPSEKSKANGTFPDDSVSPSLFDSALFLKFLCLLVTTGYGMWLSIVISSTKLYKARALQPNRNSDLNFATPRLCYLV